MLVHISPLPERSDFLIPGLGESNIPFSDSVLDEVSGFVKIQFFHDRSPMIIDREDADEEGIGDLPV